MNGPQDLGGRMGFGPIAPDPGEPLFHADWEKRALALTVACGPLGHWTLDESRHARESLPPAQYYSYSYYQIWIAALQDLLKRHGELTDVDIAQGKATSPGLATGRKLLAENTPKLLATGGPTNREIPTQPNFRPGDRVRTRNIVTQGHTRLPAYAREKTGRVEALHGAHVFPDTNAHGQGEQPQYLYTVAFDGAVLWGASAEPGLSVSIEAWESYLEPA